MGLGLHPEEGSDVTNAWLVTLGKTPFQDFYDVRPNWLTPYVYGAAFSLFGTKLVVMRWVIKVVGWFGINAAYLILRKFVNPFIAAWGAVLAFGYFHLPFGVPNAAHVLVTGVALAMALVFLYRPNAWVLGILATIALLIETTPLTPALFVSGALVLALHGRGWASVRLNGVRFASAAVGTIGLFAFWLWARGVDLGTAWMRFSERLEQMSKTAVTMGGRPVWHPMGLWDRHYAHWLGSLEDLIQRNGWVGSLPIFFRDYWYYVLALFLAVSGFVWFVRRLWLSGAFIDALRNDRLLLMLWLFMCALWSHEFIRGAPFRDHTPIYATQFTSIFMVAWLGVLFREWAVSSALLRMASHALVFAFLAFNTKVFVSESFDAARLRHKGADGRRPAQSERMRGIYANIYQLAYYDAPALYLKQQARPGDTMLALGFDTMFSFFTGLQSPLPDNTTLQMFYETPVKGYDTSAKIEEAFASKKIDWVLVPVYSEWRYPEPDCRKLTQALNQFFPARCLPEIAQRYTSKQSQKILEQDFEQVEVSLADPNVTDRVHILRLQR